MTIDKDLLLAKAAEARKAAYAPYSGFRVGAALLCEDGRIFLGCNVENAAYSPTLCAERVALGAAVAAGARRFAALCVLGGHTDTPEACTPCGVCRQVLSELCDGAMPVIFMTDAGITECRLGELLPYGFKLS